MTLLKTICAEMLGLFLDDARFAGAILAWLAACWLMLPHLPLAPGLRPALLCVGLAAILIESAHHRAGNRP